MSAMRSYTNIVIIGVLLLRLPGSACSRGDRIIKVADLPNTPDFEVDSHSEFAPPSMPVQRVHVDVGYVWKQNKLLFLPILNHTGHYVGYTGCESTYIEFKKVELAEWAA